MSFGLFEAHVSSDDESQRQHREAADKLAAATYDVRQRFGSFLFGSRDMEEYRDRLALTKTDILKTIEPHVFPRTGVVRRVLKPLENEFKGMHRQAWGLDPDKVPPGPAMDAYNGTADADAPPNRSVPMPPADGLSTVLNPSMSMDEAVNLGDAGARARGEAPQNSAPAFSGQPDSPSSGGNAGTGGGGGGSSDGVSDATLTSGGGGGGAAASGDPIGAGDYTIQSGDTYSDLAQRAGWGDDYQGFADATGYNPAGDLDMIYAGDTMTIPGAPGGTDPSGSAQATGGTEPWSNPLGPLGAETSLAGDPGAVGTNPTNDMTNPGLTNPGITPTARRQRRRAEFEGDVDTNVTFSPSDAELEPEGDFHGYLGDVDQGAEGKVDRNFVSAKHRLDEVEGDDDPWGYSNPDTVNPYRGVKGTSWTSDEHPSTRKDPARLPDRESDDPYWGRPSNLPSGKGKHRKQEGEGKHRKQEALNRFAAWCRKNRVAPTLAALDHYNPGDRAYITIASALQRKSYEDSGPTSRVKREGPWSDVVYTQGDDYNEMADMGPEEMFNHLRQWDYGDDDNVRDEAPWGTNDRLHSFMDGDVEYVLSEGDGGAGLVRRPLKRRARRRIAAPDYLQKADEALTNLLNQKAEEFQTSVAPLQQALQTVQIAEQEAQAANPMSVLPPAGTVNVLPGQDPAAGGGMDPNALAAMLGGGGGDPMAGGGGEGGIPPELAAMLGGGGGGELPPELAAMLGGGGGGELPPELAAMLGGGGGMPPGADQGGGMPPEMAQQMMAARRRTAWERADNDDEWEGEFRDAIQNSAVAGPLDSRMNYLDAKPKKKARRRRVAEEGGPNLFGEGGQGNAPAPSTLFGDSANGPTTDTRRINPFDAGMPWDMGGIGGGDTPSTGSGYTPSAGTNGGQQSFYQARRRRQAMPSLKEIRIHDKEKNLFSGVDGSGNRVVFKTSPDESKQLRDVMFGDLAQNFSGVSVGDEDIVRNARRRQAGDNSWVGNLSKAELRDLIGSPGEEDEEQLRNYDELFGEQQRKGRRRQAASAEDLWSKWVSSPQTTLRGDESDYENFAKQFGVGQRAINKLRQTHGGPRKAAGRNSLRHGYYAPAAGYSPSPDWTAPEGSKEIGTMADLPLYHHPDIGQFVWGADLRQRESQGDFENRMREKEREWKSRAKSGSRKQAWMGWGPQQTGMRRVAGFDFDHHLNGYITTASMGEFPCECGESFPVPSGYRRCGSCDKAWNSYVVGTDGPGREASLEKIIVREIPVRKDVIVANKRQGGEYGKRKPVTTLDGAEKDEAFSRYLTRLQDKLLRKGKDPDEISAMMADVTTPQDLLRYKNLTVTAADYREACKVASGDENEPDWGKTWKRGPGGKDLEERLEREADGEDVSIEHFSRRKQAEIFKITEEGGTPSGKGEDPGTPRGKSSYPRDWSRRDKNQRWTR